MNTPTFKDVITAIRTIKQFCDNQTNCGGCHNCPINDICDIGIPSERCNEGLKGKEEHSCCYWDDVINNNNMVAILQTIADKLEVNEIGYDEEYTTIRYCQSLLQQRNTIKEEK